MEQTKPELRQVTIREFYQKDEEGVIWWNYQLSGGAWIKQKTYYTDFPFKEITNHSLLHP